MRTLTNQRESQVQAALVKVRTLEDDLLRARKEVEQQAQEWKRTATGALQNKGDGEVQSLKVRHPLFVLLEDYRID